MCTFVTFNPNTNCISNPSPNPKRSTVSQDLLNCTLAKNGLAIVMYMYQSSVALRVLLLANCLIKILLIAAIIIASYRLVKS